MAHPHKSEVSSSHNAKLRRMTRNYGEADGAANIKLPQEKFKLEGPEPHVGFGVDSDAANARSDRPARRAVAANPLATYKRGGKVPAGKPVEIASRARGGRLHGKHKGSTHVNVIVAPQGQGAGAPPMAPPPQLAALAAKPPMAGPPPGGPPMAPPMAGPPPGGPPPMMPRAKGGRTNHSDEKQDKALIEKTLKDEGLVRRARGGGIKTFHMEGGSVSGPGREDKNEHWAKHGDKRKQEV